MERKLALEERVDLQRRHKKERDGRLRDRIKAVLAYDDGYSYTEIARILLLDDETIRRHIESYFSKQQLKPENGGSSSHLCCSERKLLISHLQETTYLYVKEICAYVKATYDKNYSVSGMTKWVRSNNFCYKKPHGVPAKASQEKQEAFIGYYTELKSTLAANDVIYFMDSTHPQHQTRLAYGWIRKGVRKAEKMTACQKRINLIGAINVNNHHIETKQVDWVNVQSIKAFLNQLLEANPKTEIIHLILDNAGYHRSAELQEFVSKPKIKLHYLPAYSPNLNPIERLWKIMHEQVTYNRYYVKFANFTEGILAFFRNINDFRSIIQTRINDNFQKLTFT